MDTTSEPIALTFIIALSRAHFDLSKRITSVVVEQIPDRAFNAGLKNVDRIADCDVADFLARDNSLVDNHTRRVSLHARVSGYAIIFYIRDPVRA